MELVLPSHLLRVALHPPECMRRVKPGWCCFRKGKRVYWGLQLRGGGGARNKRPLGKSCAASPGALPSVLPAACPLSCPVLSFLPVLRLPEEEGTGGDRGAWRSLFPYSCGSNDRSWGIVTFWLFLFFTKRISTALITNSTNVYRYTVWVWGVCIKKWR